MARGAGLAIGAMLLGGLFLFGGSGAKSKRRAAPPSTPSPPGSLPWMTKDDRTETWQAAINAVLISNGFRGITADGVLGPQTCAAARFVANTLGEASLGPGSLNADCRAFGDDPLPRTAGQGLTGGGTPEVIALEERRVELEQLLASNLDNPDALRSIASQAQDEGFQDLADQAAQLAEQLERGTLQV